MTRDEFLNAYTPANMWRFAIDEDRCHIGTGPTISQAAQQFGADSVHTVFTRLLQDFCSFNHSTQVITAHQLNEIAAVIVCEFRNLKVAEFILFFAKAKAGRFGKFFNSIYPMDITVQLCEWERECNQRKGELFYRQQCIAIENERERSYEDAASASEVASWIARNGQKKFK